MAESVSGSVSRNRDPLGALKRGLVGAYANHGPIHGRLGIGERWLLTQASHQKIVGEVGVRTAVTAALDERQVLGVLDRRRLSELADRIGQSVGVVRHFDSL